MRPPEVVVATSQGAILLDLRPPAAFASAHIPGSVCLQFNRADLAERASMMLPSDRSYVLLADVDVIAKTATLLLREAGFDVQGHLDGGLASWTDEGSPDSLPTMTVEELSEGLADLNVVDVRESFEFNYARIAQAVNHPSTGPWASHADLPDGSLAMVCADESRSTFVASAARLLGRDASLVRGGMTAWLDRGFPIEGRLKASGQAFDTPIALL